MGTSDIGITTKLKERFIIEHSRLRWRTLALGVSLVLTLAGCSGGKEVEPFAEPPESIVQEPLPWWQEADWEGAKKISTGYPTNAGVGLDRFKDGRTRLRFHDPMLTATEGHDGRWEFTFLTEDGNSTVVASAGTLLLDGDHLEPLAMLTWTGKGDIHATVEEDETLTLYMKETPWEGELYGIRAKAVHETGITQTIETFCRVEGDVITLEESTLPDFSQDSAQFRYLQLDTGDERVILSLYRDGTFHLSRRGERTTADELLWGTWDDGNTAITLWPDPQCCGPDGEFRLDKTGGLRVYNGGGPGSLPFPEGTAFQKVGDLLDLPLFDAAVVSKVVDGDRPAIFLSREKDEELLDAFREMMEDAAQLKQPQWTEDPEDRPNLQFDLNLNGEDVTMVLCPCIVAGTEDKYLLVQKDSWMGRVTYTYYQTQQGDDYDRMVALFEEQYEKDPQVFTAAMAAQTRAQTAAISNLDWSDDFPLDANGIPVTYKAVLREQKATGYASLRGGQTWGAGSRTSQAKTGVYYCTAGTVAVRANEIPYGTKLYIRTPGGGFIYGYAVANDTGTGLVEGIIDVDLFYDTYEESVLNSVRWVDIYILE